jgi:hypothetical protein
MLVMVTIPVGVGQNNFTIEENKESAQTLFYPTAKISWNMSSTYFELVQLGLFASCLPGLVDTYGLQWGFVTRFGNVYFLLGSKWKVTKGEMILTPIGMKWVTINPGDTIRWLLVTQFDPADSNTSWISGRAFGVIVEKA